METNNIKIIIVGGGFAGINLAKNLSKDKRFQITLIDKNNYHYFPPLLYQVASAFIESSNISYPFRRMFQKKDNLRFFMGELLEVNASENFVTTSNGSLPYDYLVLAAGTKTNYFGMQGVEKNAWPMKNINDALNLRNHILLTMEKAVRAKTRQEKVNALNIVVAGGGPTGVEISGMLAELAGYIAAKEYPELKSLPGHIHLLDAAPTLLGPMSGKAQNEAKRVLSKLGVRIQLNVAVKDYRNGVVYLSDGSEIVTDTLIWTSGVVANQIKGLPENTTGKGARILVDEFNRVKTTENIYAIGDICLQTSDPNFPKGHPQLAQVAIQHGTLLAKNLRARINGKPAKPFIYSDKGSLAIISKYKAVADLPKFSFTGYFAWLIWLFIHIIPLIGFGNKFKLAYNWFWSFMTNDPTLRLIIRPGRLLEETHGQHNERELAEMRK